MSRETNEALVAALSGYDGLVEVGIGTRTAVADALASRGARVVATDVHPRDVPEGVRFVRDDVTDPDRSVYVGADAIYALNCPPELHRPALSVARDVDADFLFTTLGADPPSVEASPRTLPGGTLYEAQ